MAFAALLTVFSAAAVTAAAAAGRPSPFSQGRPDPYSRMRFPNVAGLQAFDAAKFGLFVHWGPISQWGTEISFPLACPGFPCTVAGPGNSQIVIRNASELSAHRSAYRALASTFNPTAFNATALVELAFAAGFRYITPTAMHCDGFALYNSSVAANYSMRSTPFGRDVTGELLAAARAQGMRAGVYVCPSLWNRDDYWYPDALTTPGGCCSPSYNPVTQPAMAPVWDSFVSYLHAVVLELAGLYAPASWWFDSGTSLPSFDTHLEQVVPQLRAAEPETVVHVRDGGVWHDYVESGDHGEQDVAAFIGQTYTSLADKFEVPGTLGQQWAYDPNAVYKTAPDVLRLLIPIVSKGGNYLLNIGLDSHGLWAPSAVDTLTNLSAWFAYAGESIHDTAPMWPYQYGDAYFVQSTADPSMTYVSFWQGWNASSGILLLPSYKPSTLAAPPLLVQRLTPAGPQTLQWELTEAGLAVNVSDLPSPPLPRVPLQTWYRAYNSTHVDRAPCGAGRPCSVYSTANYTAAGVEGYCLTAPPPPGGEPTTSLRLYYNGALDNTAGVTPPSDGQSWEDVDTECVAWTTPGEGRVPLQIWRSVALGDYWALASNASLALAKSAGYELVDAAAAWVESSPQPPSPATVEAFAYVLRLQWPASS